MVWPQQVVAIHGFAALTHGAHATHKIIASDCRNHWQPRHHHGRTCTCRPQGHCKLLTCKPALAMALHKEAVVQDRRP